MKKAQKPTKKGRANPFARTGVFKSFPVIEKEKRSATFLPGPGKQTGKKK